MNIFNAEVISELFRDHYFAFLASVFLGAFVSVWYIIPKIIWVTNEKQLTKPVIERSVHVKPIPTFGGVAFFITLILMLSLMQLLELSTLGSHLIAATTVLFMVGLKDDLVVSTARVKLIGQFIAIAFLVFAPELSIDSLHGFLGITSLPAVLGYALAGFIILAIINSYNLIDGIDGLASIAGIVISLVYGSLFYLSGQDFFVLVSLAVAGMLAGFLRFNFSRGSRKIFMGDSGALIIGLVLGALTVKVISLEVGTSFLANFLPENRLLFILAVLYIPFFDTARSIVIRLLNKKSPFEPDRNHTHHVLIDAGFTHMQASLLLGVFNLGVIGVFVLMSPYFGSVGMMVVLLSLFGLSCWGFDAIKKAYPSKEAAVAASQIEPVVNGIRVEVKQRGKAKEGVKV